MNRIQVDEMRQSRDKNPVSLLSIRNVTKKYGKKNVLSDLTIQVNSGEIVAILGENGSGKSTLLKIIAGFITCDSGSVHIFGDLGYCPQDVLLYDFLTIEENIELFEHAYKRNCNQTVRRLLEAFDLQKSIKQPVSELSGGTRQKLNLIVGMMHEPSLLLLDEPYQGFDRRSYMQYQQIVKAFIDKGNSIICVVHLLGSDDFFTRALELRNGKLIKDNTYGG